MKRAHSPDHPERKYKLIYFNCRGRAEVCRWLFALAGVKYEDKRCEMEEWNAGLKEKLNTPFGQLPVLDIDDGKEVYSQSLSIARYLAEEFGYAGKTPGEKCKADMIAHCFLDYAYSLWTTVMEKEKDRKEKMNIKFKDEELPNYFKYFEAMLKENNGGDGFFVGDNVTWADLSYVHQLEYLQLLGIDADKFLEAYPKMKALKERVLKIPTLAAYIATRPEDKFYSHE